MKKVFIALMALVLFSCERKPIKKYTTDNSEFNVEHIFTVEGHKVYRFDDNGRTHYFVLKSNQAITTQSSTYTTTNGKVTTTHTNHWDENIETK